MAPASAWSSCPEAISATTACITSPTTWNRTSGPPKFGSIRPGKTIRQRRGFPRRRVDGRVRGLQDLQGSAEEVQEGQRQLPEELLLLPRRRREMDGHAVSR